MDYLGILGMIFVHMSALSITMLEWTGRRIHSVVFDTDRTLQNLGDLRVRVRVRVRVWVRSPH